VRDPLPLGTDFEEYAPDTPRMAEDEHLPDLAPEPLPALDGDNSSESKNNKKTTKKQDKKKPTTSEEPSGSAASDSASSSSGGDDDGSSSSSSSHHKKKKEKKKKHHHHDNNKKKNKKKEEKKNKKKDDGDGKKKKKRKEPESESESASASSSSASASSSSSSASEAAAPLPPPPPPPPQVAEKKKKKSGGSNKKKHKVDKAALKAAAAELQKREYVTKSPDGKTFDWHLSTDKTRGVTQKDLQDAEWFLKPKHHVIAPSPSEKMSDKERKKIYAAPDEYIGVVELPKKGEERPRGVLFFVMLTSDGRKDVPVRIKADMQKPLFAHVPYDFDIWGTKHMAWRKVRGKYIPALDAFAWVKRKKSQKVGDDDDEKERSPSPPPPPPQKTSRVIDDESSSSKKNKKKATAAAAKKPATGSKPPAPLRDIGVEGADRAKDLPPPTAASAAAKRSARKIKEERAEKAGSLTLAAEQDVKAAAPPEFVPDCDHPDKLLQYVRAEDNHASRLFVSMVRNSYKNMPEQYKEIIQLRDEIAKIADLAQLAKEMRLKFNAFRTKIACMASAQTFNVRELLREKERAELASTAPHSRAKFDRDYEQVDAKQYQLAAQFRSTISQSLARAIVAVKHPSTDPNSTLLPYSHDSEENIAAQPDVTPELLRLKATKLDQDQPQAANPPGTVKCPHLYCLVLAVFLCLYEVEVSDLDEKPAPPPSEDMDLY